MKRFLFSFLLILTVAALLFGLFLVKKDHFATMTEIGEKTPERVETVATFTVREQEWPQVFSSVGSIEPTRGVTLTSEESGIITDITFENGERVEAGETLLQLDIRVEKAELTAAKAVANLAEIEQERANRLRSTGNLPQSNLDRALAESARASADVERIEQRIRRKTIVAPFSGIVGIRLVNVGQFVSSGTPIVDLQTSDDVFVNFTLPQKTISKIAEGQKIEVATDAFPEKTFNGKLTAINPQLDSQTRAIRLQGTLPNKDLLLKPGMFVATKVISEEVDSYLTVPATAVIYAPYGNSIYKVEEKDGELRAYQQLVKLGPKRGDFISVIEGLEDGDVVVSAGAFKLRNKGLVRVDNEMAPSPTIDPKPKNT